MLKINLYDICYDNTKTFPKRTFIYFKEKKYTYTKRFTIINQMVTFMQKKGEKKCTIGVTLPNVYAKENKTIDEKDLTNFKLPNIIKVIEYIPLTAILKFLKESLKELVKNGKI